MKKLLRSFIIILIVVNLLLSCTTTKYVSMQSDYCKTYVGMSHNQIVSMLGAPDRETSDGLGGRILIYENFVQKSVATAENVNYYTRTYTPSVTTSTATSYTHIFIDSKSICYNVNTNHTKAVSERSAGKTVLLLLSILAGAGLLGAAIAVQ